ncbi:MAG: hypothetical protein J5U16_09065 [Candidatus Methanoperedens sp.]|nr:hypothetical protein [Candidatus Methanoperedens sp.]
MAPYMMKKLCINSRMNRSFGLNTENKELRKDIEFETIVKFLNAQKAVMDYAGLN